MKTVTTHDTRATEPMLKSIGIRCIGEAHRYAKLTVVATSVAEPRRNSALVVKRSDRKVALAQATRRQ